MSNKFTRVYCVINPMAGKEKPVLRLLSTFLSRVAVDYDIAVTRPEGPMIESQTELIEKKTDLVLIYGGDGTVMHVATSLIGSKIPIGVLPGGTANVVATDLRTPSLLEEALDSIEKLAYEVSEVDSFVCNGEPGLIRVNEGVFARVITEVDESGKELFGTLAYSVASFEGLMVEEEKEYRINIDGREETFSAIGVMVTNAPGLGWPGMQLHPKISLSDGLLDVLVMKDKHISTLTTMGADYLMQKETKALEHFQGKNIEISFDSERDIILDDIKLEGVAGVDVELKDDSLRFLSFKRGDF